MCVCVVGGGRLIASFDLAFMRHSKCASCKFGRERKRSAFYQVWQVASCKWQLVHLATRGNKNVA